MGARDSYVKPGNLSAMNVFGMMQLSGTNSKQ
jgi:hypothetical protein